MIKSHYPLCVIGAGPAGMAAAKAAVAQGIDVLVLDEQSQPGGQIFRNVDSSPLDNIQVFGTDYDRGRVQVLSFRQAAIDYQPLAKVWYLDEDRRVGVLIDGVNHQLSADQVVIAIGAQERPMPVPGWQLPGVMSAGAGQILFKSAALVPDASLVLAGNGPLLLLLAWQYLRAGVTIDAILDTTVRVNKFKALRYLPRALSAMDYLWKGLKLLIAIRQKSVPIYKGVTDLKAHGKDRLEAIEFISSGRSHRLQASILQLHQGLIPNLQMAQTAGCNVAWNEAQQSWFVPVDQWGQSSQPGIFIAGDGAGIAGAGAASLSGQLSGLQVACNLGRIDKATRDRLAKPVYRARQRHLTIRPFLDAWYRVPCDYLAPSGETMVCRCEEIYADEIIEITQMGCLGPNQAKAFTRCGMGPCQGRLCGSTVEQIMAQQRSESVARTGHYRARPPLKPITLGQLADVQDEGEY